MPKPAIKIAHKPIIRHILDWLESADFDNILVKTHYLADQVKDAIGEDNYVKICFNPEYIGTAQFLKLNEDKLEETFLVQNGDTLTNLDLKDIIEFHLINMNIATVFTKHDAIHTSGTYIFEKKIIDLIEDEQDIPDLMQKLIDKNIPINIYKSDAYYFDIANKEKLKKARKYYERYSNHPMSEMRI